MRRASLRGGLEYIRLGIQWLNRMHIPQLAANTGYFIVLSVFPALLLLLSGLRYTGLSVDDLLEALEGVIPHAMMSTARGLILSVYNNASGTVAGVSALTALWSSSRGMYGLLTGLNTIYGVAEDRGYLYTRSISVLYTFLFVIVLLLTLLLHVFGGTLMKFVRLLNLPGMTVLLDILDTPVSPELLPAKDNGEIAQKTEDLVGPYELHDFYLYHVLRFGFGPAKIFRLAKAAFAGRAEYPDSVLYKWLRNFYWRFFVQQFKRSCLPDGPKVGSVTLSPRGDWRMPSDAAAALWLAELEQIPLNDNIG